MVCKKIIFSGIVQKIGFRYFVFELAKSAGVVGFVRNLDNGDVELVAQGSENVVCQLISDCQLKHPVAIVNKVDVVNIDIQNFNDFKIIR